ncbi:collagen binding domain-containing protein [Microlunatus capsulatus]|uniref:alpha-amylase n=1 Tax=Microlunatus capsulatus TaxID=99117 RepID=A0ABS4Z8T5_9ACTN|nr:carboxypeptidase-like regulatory domain-containing protein [Microlunatus capsulatus]MBP2417466.1 protocatechuate 3,4-dioxygenase beta subunit [Microlunatus capsulatus]
MHRRADAAPRRPLAPRAAATLLATGLVLVGAALPAQAAPAGYARWAPLTGTSGNLVTTMTQRPAGFPVAAVRSTGVAGSGVGVQSGASTFLAPQTPPGAVYGSSRDQGYLNLRPAGLNAGPPSVTTYTFERPTPASGWTFVLGDVDADAVVVTATGADGAAVDPADLGFSGVFNSCARGVTPKPTCGPPGNDGTDLPSWDEGTATLRGNEGALDTAGASGWFQPRTALRTLTFRYSQRAGSPVYQTWFSSLQFDLAGTVSAPDDLAGGLLVELFDPSGAKVGETRTDDDGGYRFPGRAPYDGYRVRLTAPEGLTSDNPLSRTVDLGAADRTDVDFALRALEPVPVSGTVTTDDGEPLAGVTVTLTDAGGGTREDVTDAAGRYRFERVPDGADYGLAVTPPRGATASPVRREVSVPVGSEEPVSRQDFTVTPAAVPATGVVEGTVADVAGDPVADAEVTLEPTTTDADAVTATSDEDGRFVVPGLEPGPYRATLDPPEGYRTPEGQTVVVVDEDRVELAFVLEPVATGPEPTGPGPTEPAPSEPGPTSTQPDPQPVASTSAPAVGPTTAGPAGDGTGGALAATGGPSAGAGVLALLATVVGAGLLLRSRRSRS